LCLSTSIKVKITAEADRMIINEVQVTKYITEAIFMDGPNYTEDGWLMTRHGSGTLTSVW